MEASRTLVRERPLSAAAESAADGATLLYERYYDRVFGYCLYQLGSREEAEDVAQTTFMWAFRGLRRGVVPRAEASWLFTIAQNACRARHRSRGRKRAREVLRDPVTLADVSPAHAADTDELMGLEDALARMPELQRRAILLREWRGLSYKEIAAELELSNSAVETLIFRARRSLADLLGGSPAPKRARRFAFDFGSIGVTIKTLFGSGGAALKVAAGLAAAVIATTVAGSIEQAPPAPGKPVVAPVAIPLDAPAPTASAHVRAQRANHDRGGQSRRKAEGQAPGAPGPAAGSPKQVVPELSGVTQGPLETVGDELDSVVGAAAQALAPVTGAVAPVTVELP